MSHYRISAIIFGLWLLVIIVVGYISTHSRMIADDYCSAAIGNANDAFTAMLYYYNNWLGDFSNLFLKSALSSLQPDLHTWQFLIFLMTFWLVLWWLITVIFKYLGIRQSVRIALKLTILLIFVLISNIIHIAKQNIYWLAAIIPYTLPLVLIVISLRLIFWLFVTKSNSTYENLAIISLWLLIFFTAGFSSIYGTLQVTGLFLLLLIGGLSTSVFMRKKLFLILGAALIISIIGLLLVALAPGNFVRLSQQNASGVDLGIAQLGVNVAIFTLLMFIGEGNTLAFFLFTFFAVIVDLMWWYPSTQQHSFADLPYPKQPWRMALLTGMGVFLLVGAIITPPLYATNHVAARVIFPARFVQFCLFAFWGYLAAVGLAKYRFRERFAHKLSYRLIQWVLIGLMFFMPLNTLFQQMEVLQNVPRYAADWDARHEMILAAAARGETRIKVPPLSYNIEDYLQLEKIESEANANWVNGCASSYYGIQVFVADKK